MKTTCPRCGLELVEVGGGAMFLCGPGAPGAVPIAPDRRCPDEKCRTAQRREHDEAALQKAITAGIIVSDDTPEDERWVQ